MEAFNGVITQVLDDFNEICDEVDQYSQFKAIRKFLLHGYDTYPNYSLQQGQLLHKGRMILLSKSQFILKVLEESHVGPIGGYGGFLHTYKRIVEQYY